MPETTVTHPAEPAPVRFQAAFLTAWPVRTTFEVLSYTGVDHAALFDGLDNTTEPVTLDIPAVDAALAAAGYERAGEWNWTDDVWGAVIRPAGQVE